MVTPIWLANPGDRGEREAAKGSYLFSWPNHACRIADFCLSVLFLERHPYREPWHQKEVAAPNTASDTYLGTTQSMPDLLWTWGLIR